MEKNKLVIAIAAALGVAAIGYYAYTNSQAQAAATAAESGVVRSTLSACSSAKIFGARRSRPEGGRCGGGETSVSCCDSVGMVGRAIGRSAWDKRRRAPPP